MPRGNRKRKNWSELPEKLLLYPINPGPQEAFVRSEAQEVLFGGAVAGGKSYALRAIAVDYCLRYPEAKVALFRRTYRELEDTHIIEILREIPQALASYNQEAHTLSFHNGSTIFFRYCETDADVYGYDTAEFDMILFDELTQFSEFQYTYLISRCRSTKPWWPGRRIRAACTPGGPGHEWVKRRWIDYLRPMEIRKAPPEEGGLTRQFIPARVQDNPVLMARDPGYVEALRALPPDEYRAKALGDWEVYPGQFFRSWNPRVHVVDPFEIPPDWNRYLAVDYGLAAPFAALWAARPPATDAVWIYRERYGTGVPAREQARLCAEASMGEKLSFVVLDPSMFSRQKDEYGKPMRSLASLWQEAFPGIPVLPGNNERIQGAALVQEALHWTPGQDLDHPAVPPRLRIFRGCENLIRTIPLLQRSKVNPEDVDTGGEDHAYDALRYLLRALFHSPRTPVRKRYIDTPSGIVVVTSL